MDEGERKVKKLMLYVEIQQMAAQKFSILEISRQLKNLSNNCI